MNQYKISHIDQGLLTIISNLGAYRFDNGDILLTKKFIEGISAYSCRWNGSVCLLLQKTTHPSDNLDNQRIQKTELPCKVAVIDFLSSEMEQYITGSSIVLASAGYRQNHISKICNSLSIPSIYVTEYTLRARLQSLYQNSTNPLRFVHGVIWNLNQERKQRQAISIAQGLQANGTPTYDAYKYLTSNALLYFDNRIHQNDLINDMQINKRLAKLDKRKPLRLAFSGRLIRMKGVDHLIPLCWKLDKLGLDYTMTIFGDGDLASKMKHDIVQTKINDHVYMAGSVDFRSELLPALKAHIDLFVCCHMQGDPSCTYIETFACGLPIVGYNNEAFKGILHHSKGRQPGIAVACGNQDALADQILLLDQNRDRLATMSRDALSFAAKHNFEQTFDQRIAHLARIAGRNADEGEN